jgi:hypothetical protein
MADRDDLIESARQRAGAILLFYQKFADKKPVMLLELPADKIYAYPYEDFRNSLNPRSQKILEKEYQDSLAHNQIVVFVKDNDRKKMISFSVDAESNSLDG